MIEKLKYLLIMNNMKNHQYLRIGTSAYQWAVKEQDGSCHWRIEHENETVFDAIELTPGARVYVYKSGEWEGKLNKHYEMLKKIMEQSRTLSKQFIEMKWSIAMKRFGGEEPMAFTDKYHQLIDELSLLRAQRLEMGDERFTEEGIEEAKLAISLIMDDIDFSLDELVRLGQIFYMQIYEGHDMLEGEI